MNRTALMLSVAAISLSASGVLAQDGNDAFIGQLNDSNLAYLSQIGSNQGFIYQHGTGNIFLPANNGGVAQNGSNRLGVEQLGANNLIVGDIHQQGRNVGGIAQFGSNNGVDVFNQNGENRAAIFQGGHNNLARTVQDGTGNDAGIIQLNGDSAGDANFASNTQVGEGDGGDNGSQNSFAGILQGGSGNFAINTQREQVGSAASIIQAGANNQAFNTQSNDIYDPDTYPQYHVGEGNQAGIVQIGSSNWPSTARTPAPAGWCSPVRSATVTQRSTPTPAVPTIRR